MSLPRYDVNQTYQWNYDHPPSTERRDARPVDGDWDFCGIPVDSPLGVAAGPLLNGRWCLYYADLGFDVVTYKTVRSGRRECYPLPNLLPVKCGSLSGNENRVEPGEQMSGSWAVSFGMPSADPNDWRKDVEWTRKRLDSGKVLVVSVVGTVQPGWTMDDLAADYALCAKWALESGADVVEANFSCPNVSTCDGQLYQDPQQSRLVADAVRDAIGDAPLVIKIGHVMSDHQSAELVDAVGDLATALAMTNSIATVVGPSDDQLLFDRQQRGICGAAIRDASVQQVRRFQKAIQTRGSQLRTIGVGGICTGEDVQAYLEAGAHACHLATAVMTNPQVGLDIREALAEIDVRRFRT